jgi:hypothetical protein
VKKRRTVYRDSKTGRFVKRSTWKRSRAHGGNRYRRTSFKVRTGPKLKRPSSLQEGAVRPTALPFRRRLKEWLVTREYEGKRKRVLDLYVVAATKERALELVLDRILRGKDDNGYDLIWARKIPWSTEFVTEFKHDEEDEEGEKEIPTDERVEVH